MNSAYGYGISNTMGDFNFVHRMTLWAGGLGLLQSIAWMGLTVVGIVSYNCALELPKSLTFGSVTESVLVYLYFRSDACSPKPAWNTALVKSIPLLNQEDFLIWNCVYLGVAVCWLMSSTTLLIYVRKENAKVSAGVMINWAIFTGFICMMDLALAIIFGIDYNAFQDAANGYNAFSGAGSVETNAIYLVGGMISAIGLMIISMKGFLLWIINFGLMLALMTLALRALNDHDGIDTLFLPRKESDDMLTTRPPIKAYAEDIEYSNAGFVPDSQISQSTSVEIVELNQESIARAARISTDASLRDRRFRNLDSFQQYPPPRLNVNSSNSNYNNNSSSINMNNSGLYANKPRSPTRDEDATIGSSHPAPDYTPPMSRANLNATQNNGILRNQRY